MHPTKESEPASGDEARWTFAVRLRIFRRGGFVRPRRFISLVIRGSTANVVYGDLTVKSSANTSSALHRPTVLTQPFNGSNPDPRATLIERVISSTHFRSSLRLREFLR